MFSFLFAGLLGYLLGSFPTAFLAVRWKSKLDIRFAGSGNVGMLNSYQVTGSLLVGATVLAVDVAKGVAAAALAGALPGGDFAHRAFGGVCSLLGHNFPLWLRFRGGRGLATAAGAFLVLSWPIVPVWGILWCAGYAILREVNPANAVASVLSVAALGAAPGEWIAPLAAGAASPAEFRLWAMAAFVPVLLKHLAPVRAYIRERYAPRTRGAKDER